MAKMNVEHEITTITRREELEDFIEENKNIDESIIEGLLHIDKILKAKGCSKLSIKLTIQDIINENFSVIENHDKLQFVGLKVYSQPSSF